MTLVGLNAHLDAFLIKPSGRRETVGAGGSPVIGGACPKQGASENFMHFPSPT